MATSNRREFAAPWALSLKLVTVLVSGLLIGLMVMGLVSGPRNSWFWILAMVVMPGCIVFGAALFTIRGYVLEGGVLQVRRLLWNTRIDLTGLQSAQIDPEAMAGSWRIFGNGGLFCFAGRFRNRTLGSYRALVTEPSQSVVLRWADRVLVVTPDRPRRFVETLEKQQCLP